MKKYKMLIVSIITILVILFIAYLYSIQGEKSNKDISWITEIPIAHRGLDNDDIPENSIKAFENAIKNGYAIELDVRLTKDKEVVVFHDENLLRLTGDSRDINDVNYNELKNLKLENTDETIPKLKDVLDLVNNQVPLLIEIKNDKDSKGLAKKTCNILKNYEGKYAIQSFDPFILQWFKENANEVTRCQLSCDFTGEAGIGLKLYEKFLLKNMMLNFLSKPHVIAYDLNSIDTLSVNLLKDKYPLISWNIKNEEDLKEGYEKSDNIIFDNILP